MQANRIYDVFNRDYVKRLFTKKKSRQFLLPQGCVSPNDVKVYSRTFSITVARFMPMSDWQFKRWFYKKVNKLIDAVHSDKNADTFYHRGLLNIETRNNVKSFKIHFQIYIIGEWAPKGFIKRNNRKIKNQVFTDVNGKVIKIVGYDNGYYITEQKEMISRKDFKHYHNITPIVNALKKPLMREVLYPSVSRILNENHIKQSKS
jgi:hypothetical protein